MSQSKRASSQVVVVVLLAIALFGGVTTVLRSQSAQQTGLPDIGSVEEFQAVFNSGQGAPRLVLLLSPT